MAIERAAFLEVLKESYSAYYDIFPVQAEEAAGLPLAFRAEYRSRDERYWLSKSIPIWGNETNEFAYIFSAERFDEGTVGRCIDFALAEGLSRVKPHKEHQYSNVKVIFVAEGVDEAVRRRVEKSRFSKSYRMSLHGYSELHAALVDLALSRAYTNRAGYKMADYFKKLFAVRGEKN